MSKQLRMFWLTPTIFVQLEVVGSEAAHEAIGGVEDADVDGDHADPRADGLVLRRSDAAEFESTSAIGSSGTLRVNRMHDVMQAGGEQYSRQAAYALPGPVETTPRVDVLVRSETRPRLLLEEQGPGAILYQPPWRTAHH